MQVGILPRRFLAEEREGARTGQGGKGPTALNSILVAYPCKQTGDPYSKTSRKKLSLQRPWGAALVTCPGDLWQEPYRPVLPGRAGALGYRVEKEKTEVGDVTQE